MLERVVEALLIVIAARTGMRALGMPHDLGWSSLRAELRRRRAPIGAITLTAALTVGALVSVCWSGAERQFARVDGGAWWRTLTAAFVQGPGILGAAFNVVTALVVLALAEWLWGRTGQARGAVLAVGTWLVGAWAPVGSAAAVVGYHVSAQHAEAYSYGSSGATYFVAGGLCATLLVTGRGRTRALGLVAPAIGLAAAVVLDDGHGVLLDAGFVAALVVLAAVAAGRVIGGAGPVPRLFRPAASDFSQRSAPVNG